MALSGKEREYRLCKASEDYMAGAITLEMYQDAQNRYGVDYRAAAEALAERHRTAARLRTRRLWHRFEDWLTTRLRGRS